MCAQYNGKRKHTEGENCFPAFTKQRIARQKVMKQRRDRRVLTKLLKNDKQCAMFSTPLRDQILLLLGKEQIKAIIITRHPSMCLL